MDNNLRNIVNRQKEILVELENEVKFIENSDLSRENERLKAEFEKLNAEHVKSEQDVKTLSEHNRSLKNALHEQIYNEKVKIVNSTKEKLEIYFKSTFENETNRLTALENNIKSRINYMTSILQRNNVDLKNDIYGKLDELSAQVNLKATEAQKHFAESHGVFSQNEQAEFEALKNERITDEQVLATAKKNNIERFVGLNLLNAIGIFLIIIGVITAARYTYFQLPDTLKGIMMFALGGIMLIAGEIMNRKRSSIFSLGITAGGVGVLYVAIAACYFGLRILDREPALVLFILLTVAAFFLSIRYNSQTILTFALIGGYLPLFSIKTDMARIYGAMAYFIILNLLALVVSFRKKWTVSSFIGLFLNIAGTIYICTMFNHDSNLLNKFIAISYIMFAFLNYTLIPAISTYKNNLKFRKRDVVLLAINTLFNSLIMYSMFYSFDWQDFTGILTIVFAVVYLLLGRLIESKFNSENNMQALFYLTGLAFVVLIIPFQFGRAWLTLGWLAEGIAITAFGILKDEKNFKRAGFTINALCLFVFLFSDVLIASDYLFAYKYLSITAGSLIILAAYMYNKTLSGGFQKFFKYATIINLWFYAIYISSKLKQLLEQINYYHNITHLTTTLAITLTFIIAYVSPRVRILSDFGTKLISMILYIAGIAMLFEMNSDSYISGAVPIYITIIATAILAAVSLFSVFAVHDLVKLIVMERKLGVEWYPLIISTYFVIMLTQNLITQYNLSFASAWISIIYVLTALAWIVFGFVKRYSFIRKFGLGLALMTVIKLFIIDLSSLTSGYRILSYFVLGITLVAISFVYQHFNRRLEMKMGALNKIEENN